MRTVTMRTVTMRIVKMKYVQMGNMNMPPPQCPAIALLCTQRAQLIVRQLEVMRVAGVRRVGMPLIL